MSSISDAVAALEAERDALARRLEVLAERITELSDPSRAPERVLTVQEVAELARCEHKTVRRAIAKGRLEAFRPAQKLLVREQDARAWIESRPASRPMPAPRPRRGGRRESGSVANLRRLESEAGSV